MKTFYILSALAFCVLVFHSCGKVEYSPHQKFDSNTPQQLNEKNIKWLQSKVNNDTLRFVLSGDSQREYEDSEEMVNIINRIRGVDFVLLNGDISDFGLYQEMEWMNDIFSKLNVPYITVLGNHDLYSGSGKAIYNRMYGPENFSFVYDSIKFVCHDANSREYNFNGKVPDIPWLANELQPQEGVKGYIGASHVPPYDVDFDKNLEQEYTSLLVNSPNFIASLHAHINKTQISTPYGGNIPFIVTKNVKGEEFILIDIIDGKISFQAVPFDADPADY